MTRALFCSRSMLLVVVLDAYLQSGRRYDLGRIDLAALCRSAKLILRHFAAVPEAPHMVDTCNDYLGKTFIFSSPYWTG